MGRILLIFTTFVLPSIATAATIPGNGATGFGGPVGLGSLDISDSAGGMTFTFNRGTNGFNDDLVLYLDTKPGGFIDNLLFGDNGDQGRTAISGTNNGNPSKSLVNLPFAADYAFSIQNGFIGVFELANGGNNSFNFLFGQNQSGNNLDASYSINMTPAQMAQIGLTAGASQTFQVVGSYTSTSAYRSNETIGASITVPGDGSGNAGFNNSQTFTQGITYTLVPEPTSIVLYVLGLIGFVVRRRRL
jgi:hypothetical protein